jgi:hypothetical protein
MNSVEAARRAANMIVENRRTFARADIENTIVAVMELARAEGARDALAVVQALAVIEKAKS